MNRRYVMIGTMAIALAAASVQAPSALAGPFGGPHGGGGGGMRGGPGPGMLFPMMLRRLDLTTAQRAQVKDIMVRHRAKLAPLFKQVRAAHDEVASKLFAPGPVTAEDLAPSIQRLGQAKQQLLQEWTQAALETRAVLTQDQLAKAADLKQRLDALRSQMDDLLGHGDVPQEDGE